jgi:uncharacterized protein (DUF1810 family)
MMHRSGKSAFEMLGSPDDLKFRSCLTLFRQAASDRADHVLFTEALNQFYDGEADARTVELLKLSQQAPESLWFAARSTAGRWRF